MTAHFQREIDHLKKQILAVGAVVEERIAGAIAAVMKHDATLARQIVEGDAEIDRMEIDVEEECTNWPNGNRRSSPVGRR
ncbi:hypothetical protein C2W62_25170 [Candidatus Entotheonella serta]|nr:hypothetical protein C2W62_25170 [Candidatus Entotheonella serta]